MRVLDLTHQVAGPSATLMLAFLGAEVVKVIAPGSRDSYDGVAFYLNNASKKSIELDLKSEAGVQTALRLADRADIFVENFSPGVIDRLGLSWDVLSERNPRLIYAQVKGFAEDSPYRDFPCFDPIAQGFAGGSAITGEPDGLPMKPGPDVGDTGTGMVLVGAILAALYQRERDGLGQRVQIAMTDQVATFMRIHFGWPIERQMDTPRFGNRPPFLVTTAPSDIFPCPPFGPSDYVHIHAGSDRQWERMAKLMGREDMLGDERFATMASRGEHKAEVDAAVRAWTATLDKMAAMAALGAAGVPAGALRSTTEVLNDGDLRERGIFVTVDDPGRGKVTIPAYPVKMSRSPVRVTAPPQPGQHTAEVLRDWLGADAAAVEPSLGHRGARTARRDQARGRDRRHRADRRTPRRCRAPPGSWPFEAILAALADAGIDPKDVDGLCRFAPPFETVSEPQLVRALGIGELTFFAESPLGGEALGAVIAHAAAAVKARLASTVVVYRALSQSKGGRFGRADGRGPGGAGPRARAPRRPERARRGARGGQPVVRLAVRAHVARPAVRPVGQKVRHRATASPTRTSTQALGAIAITQRRYANNNPNAMMRDRKMDADDYRNARMISEPLRLFDLCLENDGACAYVVTGAETARALRDDPVYLLSATQTISPYREPMGIYVTGELLELFPPAAAARLFADAGVGRKDIDVAEFYDATSYMPLRSLESYGFVPDGQAWRYVTETGTGPDSPLPVNTHGGHLSEAYLHGMNGVLEAVRQLRGTAANQVADPEIALVGAPAGSAMILAR